MYTFEDRDRIKDLLIAKAEYDPRITAAALVGSLVTGGDRWSDLDLTFGVQAGTPIETALEQWSADLERDHHAVVLFDLPIPGTIYRVFLLPGGLQVDLSFTAQAEFGARSPRFRLLFGEAIERPESPPPAPDYRFGLGVLCVTHAYTCIQRDRPLQAEHWIHEARFQTLTLACVRLGLDTSHARGFSDLPPDVTDPLTAALVRDLTPPELRRAHAAATAGILREAQHTLPDLVAKVRPLLESLFGSPIENP